MFTDSERTLDIVNDNLTNFMLAIVEFIEKVMEFFKTLGGMFGGEEETTAA